MNTETQEVILTNSGEPTELAAPADFGQGMTFLNPAEMPDLDAAEEGMSIEPKYYEFLNAGDSLRAIYNGLGHITKKNPNGEGLINTPAVVLQTKDGVFLQAGANLLQQLRNIPPGTAVSIKYLGKEKTNGGFNVNKFDVRLLNVPRANVPALPQIKAPAPQQPAAHASIVDDEEPVTETVDTLHFWAVNEAAKAWNIEARAAAQQIGKAKLGKMDKTEFLEWLKNPYNFDNDLHESA